MSTISIGPLGEWDLAAADHIMRLAFGTFLGLPEPTAFMGDAGYVRTRWVADSTAAFGARLDGELVGSNFATHWGSVGIFGPLTVHPAHWNRGIGSRLMEPVMELFHRWGVTHAGLFTFAHSEKHARLYQKFGFWPRFLTAIMARAAPPATGGPLDLYSAVPPGERCDCLNACRAVTGAVYEGFDLEREIRAVDEQGLGDTVLVMDGSEVVGLAVCHAGPETEAGSDTCYVKVGVVAPGPGADSRFTRLLGACEAFAAARGLERLNAGVNLGRHEAYRALLDRGYRTILQGVAITVVPRSFGLLVERPARAERSMIFGVSR
ncbi:MAG: GNAT family N-acetyltransferase [Pseudonocardiaceae bacterium]